MATGVTLHFDILSRIIGERPYLCSAKRIVVGLHFAFQVYLVQEKMSRLDEKNSSHERKLSKFLTGRKTRVGFEILMSNLSLLFYPIYNFSKKT